MKRRATIIGIVLVLLLLRAGGSADTTVGMRLAAFFVFVLCGVGWWRIVWRFGGWLWQTRKVSSGAVLCYTTVALGLLLLFMPPLSRDAEVVISAFLFVPPLLALLLEGVVKLAGVVVDVSRRHSRRKPRPERRPEPGPPPPATREGRG